MADRFGGVPVKAEMTARNGEVSGDGQLFFRSKPKQGAVVADAETQLGSGRLGRAEANSLQQGQLAQLGRISIALLRVAWSEDTTGSRIRRCVPGVSNRGKLNGVS